MSPGNIIMLDPDRKHSLFYSKATHQLRQIQYNCREVAAMSKHLSTLSSELASSELNCRKVEIYKGEIKDKLKEFGTSVDEIYKVLDRKIMIVMSELKKIDDRSMEKTVCNRCNTRSNAKPTEENEKMVSSEAQRLFSDTLNPRVTHLEAKINEYQINQGKLKAKIAELKTKNQTLLQEFNRLSTASNRKINELANKISKDSFSSQEPSPKKVQNTMMNLSPTKPKKNNLLNFQTEQFSYQLSNEAASYTSDLHLQEKSKGLNFGCLPRMSKPANPLLISNASESYQKLDRQDKNRRFDLLLNKLRDSQQQSTDESHSQPVHEEPGSVFSHNIVQRYHI